MLDGPLEFPFLEKPPDALVDLVKVDWERVGKRIAQDILSGDAFRQSETAAFEADAHLQVPLRPAAGKRRVERESSNDRYT